MFCSLAQAISGKQTETKAPEIVGETEPLPLLQLAKSKEGTHDISLHHGLQEELQFLCLSEGVPENYLYIYIFIYICSQLKYRSQLAIKKNFISNCSVQLRSATPDFPLQHNSYGRYLPAQFLPLLF